MLRAALVVVVACGVALASAAAASRGAPFVYGAKRDDAPKPEPRVVDVAGVADRTGADAGWKATASPRVVANLADPKPVKDKHLSAYHQPGQWAIAHVREPKPQLKRVRADEGVRSHILVREPRRPAPEERHTYVRAHSADVDPHRAHVHRASRDIVTANAHIDADETPKRAHRRQRDLVVANAHITRDAPRRRHARKPEPELQVANAHITADRPRHHKHAAEERDIVSAHVSMRGRGFVSSAPAPKEPEPEREIVSADVRVVF